MANEKTSDIFSKIISLRVSQSEYQQIDLEAKKSGRKISALIHDKVFESKTESLAFSKENDSEKRLHIAAKNLTDKFKKIGEDYHDAVTELVGFLQQKEMEKTVGFKALVRSVSNLVEYTLELKNEVNETLGFLKASPIHTIAKPMGFQKIMDDAQASFGPLDNSRDIEFQTVVILGNLTENPYVRSEDSMTFSIASDIYAKGEKKVSFYKVYYKNTQSTVMPVLAKGDLVAIYGLLSFHNDKNIIITKEIITTKNIMQKVFIVGTICEDVKEFTVGESQEKMSFRISVENYYKKEKSETVYDVVADKTKVVAFLKKGKQLLVAGNLYLETEPQVRNIIYADTIKLFSNK